ncbi:MAG: class I SAM-dependent methyltransferase [Caldilineaceae bacterium]
MDHTTLMEREYFWKEYYNGKWLAENEQPQPWLDLSNERVYAQTLSLALQAAGPVGGRRCLDVGCGWGQMALCLRTLGGHSVGIDIVEGSIAELQRRYPHIQWVSGSFADRSVVESLGRFDVILAIEVLQYVDWADTLSMLWSNLNAQGRIVGVIPNADCPIVQRSTARFEGNYRGVEAKRLSALLDQLPSLNTWAMQGILFRRDQQLWPYETTSWSNTWNWPVIPNRLMFVAQKC